MYCVLQYVQVLATDMSKHFKHLGELKTLLETKKVANDGILVLDKYSDRSEVGEHVVVKITYLISWTWSSNYLVWVNLLGPTGLVYYL